MLASSSTACRCLLDGSTKLVSSASLTAGLIIDPTWAAAECRPSSAATGYARQPRHYFLAAGLTLAA
jgi:hypothetical protein